eukprot:5714555-Amphidinium_carterae.1
MNRVRAFGWTAHVKARIVKSFHSVGLHGAEVGHDRARNGRASHQRPSCAWKFKGASLRKSATLELMAHGSPTGDPTPTCWPGHLAP